MKKLFLLLALAVGVSTTTLHAQDQQRDPQQMAQRMKERMKPQLVERTHLSDTQAEQVMDLYIASRQEMRNSLRDLSPEDRQQKISEYNQKLEKNLLAIPLTVEQIGTVMRFFEEQRQQARQNRPNGGGGQ